MTISRPNLIGLKPFPNSVLLPMAAAALLQIKEWQVEKIQRTLSGLTNLIAKKALELGCAVLPPPDRVGHFLGIRPPHGISPKISERLAKEKIFISIRGDAIRIAPYLYNNEQDVEKIFTILRKLI